MRWLLLSARDVLKKLPKLLKLWSMYGINIKSMKKNKFHVLVVGGGPSGLMAAISAAENGFETAIIEKNDKLAQKLRISGKGRCNILNNCSVEEVVSEINSNRKFIKSAL